MSRGRIVVLIEVYNSYLTVIVTSSTETLWLTLPSTEI